jgi:hypothetical protein
MDVPMPRKPAAIVTTIEAPSKYHRYRDRSNAFAVKFVKASTVANQSAPPNAAKATHARRSTLPPPQLKMSRPH